MDTDLSSILSCLRVPLVKTRISDRAPDAFEAQAIHGWPQFAELHPMDRQNAWRMNQLTYLLPKKMLVKPVEVSVISPNHCESSGYMIMPHCSMWRLAKLPEVLFSHLYSSWMGSWSSPTCPPLRF